ncbi:MAG: hypothetical protein ACP5J4_18870 [Anaerolineae bacterium]
MTDQALRMKMLRAVALRADSFYGKAQNLGSRAAQALTDKKRSQINGLEGVANSALKTTDVFDFIKMRVARQDEWRKGNWGPELLDYLSKDLRDQRKAICRELEIEDPNSAEGIQVHLLLIREFVRQLAVQYEYACEFPN